MLRSILACSLLLPACAESGPPDELAGEVSTDATVTGASTYFELWADLRKCASPMCGGYFVARLNRSYTVCLDHTARAACYLPALDWSEANVADDQHAKLLDAARLDATSDGVRAIVRGRLAPQGLVIGEAWLAEGDAVSEGVFVRAEANGIECIAAPCPTITETALNTTRSANIAEIDWSYAGLSDREVTSLTAALATDPGVILAGDRYTVCENGRTAKGRTATAVYQQLK